MATDNILRTYGDTNIKADISSLITILTARENFFLNNLRRTKALATVHVYQTDTLATAASPAVEEAADFSYNALTTPSKVTNLVELMAEPIKVSKMQQWVEHYSGDNELTRQTAKALMTFANKAELDIVRSSKVSGVSGTAPKMDGIIYAISKSTNTTVHNSGTTFSASIVKGLMKAQYDQGNGVKADELYMGSYLKNVADSFSGNRSTTVFLPSGEGTISDSVDKYQTGFGVINFKLHRYVQQSSDATGRVLGVNRDSLALAMLKEPYMETDLAVTGPFTPRAIVGAMTVEVRHQDANFFAEGFDID